MHGHRIGCFLEAETGWSWPAFVNDWILRSVYMIGSYSCFTHLYPSGCSNGRTGPAVSGGALNPSQTNHHLDQLQFVHFVVTQQLVAEWLDEAKYGQYPALIVPPSARSTTETAWSCAGTSSRVQEAGPKSPPQPLPSQTVSRTDAEEMLGLAFGFWPLFDRPR